MLKRHDPARQIRDLKGGSTGCFHFFEAFSNCITRSLHAAPPEVKLWYF
jgi:hypothetical protein